MKSGLVRLFALVNLATSVAAFAAPAKKHDDANANSQQVNCVSTMEEGKQKKEKNAQEESQAEKDFDRVLMATHN
jgi:ribosomal protein L12E/L44/L45/RPP1/RPP2